MKSGVDNFWLQHLAGISGPMIHLVKDPNFDLHSIERECGRLAFKFFSVDLNGVNSAGSLLKVLSAEMDFPEWGHNWDALSDVLRDLSWAHGVGYCIVFTHAEFLLSLTNADLATFVGVIEMAVRDWRDQRGEYGDRPGPVPFHVIFSGTESQSVVIASKLREPSCTHINANTVEINTVPTGLRNIDTLNAAKHLIDSGSTLEAVLSFLRNCGLDKQDSAYASAFLLNTSYAGAMAFVELSEAWADQYFPPSAIRNVAQKALDSLDDDES
jgi:hypothetical protein